MDSDSSPSRRLTRSLLISEHEGLESNVDIGNPLDSNRMVHHYWRTFDDSFMRPIFGGRGFTPVIPNSETDEIPR